ncbi:MAG TPA: hypothetical protein VIU38_08190, partial [Anaerolineales bacterium]
MNRLADILSGPGRVTIPRRLVIAFLAAFFTLAFVLSPYWSLMPTLAGRLLALFIIIVVGAAWSYFSASDIDLRDVPRAVVWAAVLFVLIALLNARALTAVIPWRGDESTFITRTRDLITRVPLAKILILKVLFIAILVGLAIRSRVLTIAAVLLEVAAIGIFLAAAPFDGVGATVMIRWPYLNYWLFSGPPMLASYVWDQNHEFLYRLLPLASAVGAAWAVHRKLTRIQPLGRLLWALACATIPLVLYYSSVLYIDVTAMFLMVIACFRAEELLGSEPATLRREPAWLALLLLGFLKDTVIIFLACWLICRVAIRAGAAFKNGASALRRTLGAEAVAAFSILAPYAIYTAFRLYLINIRTYTRGYSADVQRLLDPAFYRITGQALMEQFGLFLVLFLAGLVLILWRRQYRLAAFLLLLFVAVPVFYGLDAGSAGLYGYSRFNLFVLPAILTGAVAAIDRIGAWRRIAAVVVAALVIAENAVASPVNPDGTKQPFWGNYQIDVSEHYYPYDVALLWLKDHHEGERVLFSPMFYRYYLSFYFAKFEYHPDYDILLTDENADEAGALAEVLSEAANKGFDAVLFQVKDEPLPLPDGTGAFCLEKTFRNQAHVLLLFSKGGPCQQAALPRVVPAVWQ